MEELLEGGVNLLVHFLLRMASLSEQVAVVAGEECSSGYPVARIWGSEQYEATCDCEDQGKSDESHNILIVIRWFIHQQTLSRHILDCRVKFTAKSDEATSGKVFLRVEEPHHK